jgi:Domain of unknown function (DUF1902)
VSGLVAEAASIELPRPKVPAMIGDLIEEGVISSELAEFPLEIIAVLHSSPKSLAYA